MDWHAPVALACWVAAEMQHCRQPCSRGIDDLNLNPSQVRARQLWGNIVYTQDSDLVAVLMHNGFYNHSLQQPPASMAEVPSPAPG